MAISGRILEDIMRKLALLILTMTFPAGVYAAELNTICAGDIKNDISGQFSVLPSARAYPAPACSAVGDDVRIPEECCSGKAEPNQNGEMTCVAAHIPTCAAIGDDVRIPEECCSGNAEPNQNGEMTCIAPVYPACAAVGDDVRIPAECCSGRAEPNQNGEMTCIAEKRLAKKTLLLLDPRTGSTHVVIPAGAGFIYAASGKYVTAVYNGSGYILRDGTYMPVVGGSRAKASQARVEATGAAAAELWKALDLVSKLEDVDFHAISGDRDVLAADSISCVDDNYVACSMFVSVNGERKLIVTLDAAAKLIRAFYTNGFYFDEETWILYASSAQCVKAGDEYSCVLKP